MNAFLEEPAERGLSSERESTEEESEEDEWLTKARRQKHQSYEDQQSIPISKLDCALFVLMSTQISTKGTPTKYEVRERGLAKIPKDGLSGIQQGMMIS